jgi:putative ABC transport system permease protein
MSYDERSGFTFGGYVVRTAESTDDSVHAVRAAITRTEPAAVVSGIQTVEKRFADTIRMRTFAAAVVSSFWLSGGIIAVLGLGSIVSFVVTKRRREIAIRVAIGASRTRVIVLVACEAIAAAAVGTGIGLVAGKWIATGLRSFTYGIDIDDWLPAFVAGTAAFALMIIAAVIAARQALIIAPAEALRSE